MQDQLLNDHSGRFHLPDLDGDGEVITSRTRDYVAIRVTGGNAGPIGCTVNLSPADARELAERLIFHANQAIRYADERDELWR